MVWRRLGSYHRTGYTEWREEGHCTRVTARPAAPGGFSCDHHFLLHTLQLPADQLTARRPPAEKRKSQTFLFSRQWFYICSSAPASPAKCRRQPGGRTTSSYICFSAQVQNEYQSSAYVQAFLKLLGLALFRRAPDKSQLPR